MALGVKVLLLMIVEYQLNGINALECLKCDRVISPRHCHGKTTCTSNEFCYVDRITGYDGETYYNVGCKSRELCGNTLNNVTVQRNSFVSDEQMTCSTCCQGDLCNNAGCGAQGYPTERGPVCYNCQQSIHPKNCDMVAVCALDELCYIERREEFGDIFYTTKCLSKQLCKSDSHIIFGKRNAMKTTCKSCCPGDLCNDNCSATVHAQTSALPHNTDYRIFKCDFETGLCNWTQDFSDYFDWTRNRGPTGTTGTGPLMDHTYGSFAGHYMYIESSAPRRSGEKARLISPTINLTDRIPVCMSFWYNMYGPNIGTLTIYVKTSNKHDTKWSMTGSQGQGWHNGNFTISENEPSKIIVEGTIGTSYRGDIAIDDVRLETGKC